MDTFLLRCRAMEKPNSSQCLFFIFIYPRWISIITNTCFVWNEIMDYINKRVFEFEVFEQIRAHECFFFETLINIIDELGHYFDQKRCIKSPSWFFCAMLTVFLSNSWERKSFFSVFIFEQKVLQSSNLVYNFTIRIFVEIIYCTLKFY